MATAAHPAPAVPPRFTAGRLATIVAGSIGALIGVALLVGGIAITLAHLTLRDADGFYMSSSERIATTTRALTSDGLDLGAGDRAVRWAAATAPARVRIRAARSDGRAVFVGIASERAVSAYLHGVAHEVVSDVNTHPFSVDAVRYPGHRVPGPPARASFWAASASGAGAQTAEWRVREGRWAVVVMNADGRPGVAADVSVGARVPWLVWIGMGLVAIGLLSLAGGGGLVSAGLADTRPAERTGIAGDAPGPASTARPDGGGDVAPPEYPVRVEARLDEPLSRWLWLVKWLLALPHWIVLALLWVAVAVLWVVALVAIVLTGRYPRAIFNFDLGVLRWTWRVWFYATGAIGTDRYPPFAFDAPGYPAELDVPYPERLSRGRALVKWWLLALPHYVIAGIFLGGWNAGPAFGRQGGAPGLLTVLVLVAGVVLLFTGRYPRDVFALVVGICRWLLRVAAYVLLMRDEYPPFRLGR